MADYGSVTENSLDLMKSQCEVDGGILADYWQNKSDASKSWDLRILAGVRFDSDLSFFHKNVFDIYNQEFSAAHTHKKAHMGGPSS